MAESDFSWLKLASFVGAAILLILAFVVTASGIKLITEAETFRGVCCIIGGLLSGACSVLVYINYQRESDSRYKK